MLERTRGIACLLAISLVVTVAMPALARAATAVEDTSTPEVITLPPDETGGGFEFSTDEAPQHVTVLPKPALPSHADVAPEEDDATEVMGTGTNYITFDRFRSGDIVVVLGSLTGHAGVFDKGYYNGLYSYAIWSASKEWPLSGRVRREQCASYRKAKIAYGLWVPSRATRGSGVRYYCRAQNGEPYNIASSKSDQSRWYCSKLAWAGWRYYGGIDLDADGGYWVWPIDLVKDPDTRVFGIWT